MTVKEKLQKMTVSQLRGIVKKYNSEFGIMGYSKLKKGDLIEAMTERRILSKVAAKPEVKEAAAPKPKPAPPKPKTPEPELTTVKGDIDFEDLYKELGKGFQSRRNFTSFKKKFGEETLGAATNARLARDFYSTPPECILRHPVLVRMISSSASIFEPTAGLGALVYTALKAGAPRSVIKANDIVPEFSNFIRKNFKVETTNKDFLKTDYKGNDFDLIMMNPPFSFGGNKKFYMDFFYKGVEVLRQSKRRGLKQMIFIAPEMGEPRRGGDLLLEENFTISDKKKKELYKKYGLEDEIIDGEPQDVATQINVIGTCDNFGGAGIRAKVYEVIV